MKHCSLALGAALAVGLSSGCASSYLYPEPNQFANIEPESVLLVGKVEIRPKVSPEEVNIKLGTFDPMNFRELYYLRAMLAFSDQPSMSEKTNNMINPKLEQFYFFSVPRRMRFITFGTVFTTMQVRAVSRHSANMFTNEIQLPSHFQLPIQSQDRAVYIGTWVFHRDEFNSVTKMEILDEFDVANAAFQKRFGSGRTLRKAIVQRR